MRVLIPIVLLLILGSGPSMAQSLRVQSGDHPGFTRLVIPIGANREWQLEPQTETLWTLSVSPEIDGFDLSGAFDIIQRTRLSELSADTNLSLFLACPCEVSSFRFQERFLVIDIADPDPDAPSQLEATEVTQPQSDPALEAITTQNPSARLPDLTALFRGPRELPEIPNMRGTAFVEGEVEPLTPQFESQQPDENRAQDSRLAEAAEIMAEQLARAAASGLLDASLNQPMTIADPSPALHSHEETPSEVTVSVAGEEDPTTMTAEADATEATRFPPGALPIRAATAFDPAISLDLQIRPVRAEDACNGVAFDVRDWASGNGFHQEIGALRLALYDERDMLTDQAATRLAQYYLYYGFGAEAAFWLSQMSTSSENLVHLAALVDGADTAPFSAVENPDDCSDGELLWRYMAGAVDSALASNHLSAIQRGFGELPSGLRDQMGPSLARRLAQDGHARAARNIRDTLYRGGRISASQMRLIDLELGIDPDGTTEETRAALRLALRDDGGDPVTVMTVALAFDRTLGIRPEMPRVTSAEALLREAGDSSGTDALWHEVMLAYAALGQIDNAIGMLNQPSRSNAARARALTDLIADRVTVGDIAALVILAHAHGANWQPEGSAAGRIQVQAIDALRSEGLYEAAQILRDVRQPLILPVRPTAPVANQDRSQSAWSAGDWSLIAQTATGTHANIATRMAAMELSPDQPEELPDTSPDLDAMSAAVGDSRELRAVVAELLTRPSPP